MKLRRLAASAADPAEFLAGANAAYGRWGGEALFAWAFRDDAEILLLDDGGRAFAGCGVVFRTAAGGGCAAIMAAAWTLPEARGRGAFTRLAEAARDIGFERGGFLAAFVRRENASSRALERLGAAMHPAFYCRSNSETLLQCHSEPPERSAGRSRNPVPGHTDRARAGDSSPSARLATTFMQSLPDTAVDIGPLEAIDPDPAMFPSTFRYTAEQWRAQFLRRPGVDVECLGRRGEWCAVVEPSAEFDRVHAVSHRSGLPRLAARAHARGRRLFWYTTRPPAVPCEWTEGFVARLPAGITDLDLQNGDRI